MAADRYMPLLHLPSLHAPVRVIPASHDLLVPTSLKEVTFVTPVLFGQTIIPEGISARKFSYRRGMSLHEEEVPEVCNYHPLGMVIDLPDDGDDNAQQLV